MCAGVWQRARDGWRELVGTGGFGTGGRAAGLHLSESMNFDTNERIP